MEKLNQLIEQLHEARSAFRAQGEAALKEGFREFFAANPEVTAFAWTQYAPYFNDGEPCEFSVNDIFSTTMSLDDEEFDASELATGGYYGEETPAAIEFARNLHRIPEDLFRDIFGDDALVLVTRDGIKTEDHAHD